MKIEMLEIREKTSITYLMIPNEGEISICGAPLCIDE